MALIKPDLTQTTDSVGPGTYKVRIKDASIGEWAGKDGGPATTFINWRMETFGEAESKNNGRAIWNKTPVAGKGAFRLKDLYKAAMGEDLDGQFDTDMLMGKEVSVSVVDGVNFKTGEPTGYTEVKTIRPISN